MRNSRRFVLIVSGLWLGTPAVVAAGTPTVVAASTVGPSTSHPACADSWKNPAGGPWTTGSDWSSGSPPGSHEAACITLALRAPVVLSGSGTAGSLVVGGSSRSDQLMLDNATLTLSSDATVASHGELFGSGSLSLPRGETLTNSGMVAVTPGTLNVAADIENRPTGTIVVAGDGGYAAALTLDGAVTLDNEGTIDIGALNSALYTGTTGRIVNAAGTIANAGTISVGDGCSSRCVETPGQATFVEGTGSTTGNAILVWGGTLALEGSGASYFSTTDVLSGNIAAGQTVEVRGTTQATASFTNRGTIIGYGGLAVPPGGTLTNEGTIEDGAGSSGYPGLAFDGNLVNASSGVIGENDGGITMGRAGTTFTNAGTIYMLWPNGIVLAAGNPQTSSSRDITFRSTGTIYWGTGGASWGGVGDATVLEAYGGDTVDLGGTIVPVPLAEPSTGAGGGITYGLTGGHLGPDGTPEWTLTCNAKVAGGWSLSCGNVAELVEGKATTHVPTVVSVRGSGAPDGSAGWQSPYGHPVTLTATVSAQNKSSPSGTVAFFGAHSVTEGKPGPDLLGMAKLSPKSGGPSTASLTIQALPPGTYLLLALYEGDSGYLASNTQYGSPGLTPPSYGNEVISQQTTSVALSASRTKGASGVPVTFEAKISPSAVGREHPTGVVTFFDNGTPIGVAPVSTVEGVTAARLTTETLPVGSYPIIAAYPGDIDFAGAASSPLTETVVS